MCIVHACYTGTHTLKIQQIYGPWCISIFTIAWWITNIQIKQSTNESNAKDRKRGAIELHNIDHTIENRITNKHIHVEKYRHRTKERRNISPNSILYLYLYITAKPLELTIFWCFSTFPYQNNAYGHVIESSIV